MHPRWLSQIINEELNKNFYDLVNYYRIEEAKKLLVSVNGERTILDIAYDVGFNTKSSFNRAFKKQTRMTPSQFKQKFSNTANPAQF